jgi:hypothetical protein
MRWHKHAARLDPAHKRRDPGDPQRMKQLTRLFHFCNHVWVHLGEATCYVVANLSTNSRLHHLAVHSQE